MAMSMKAAAFVGRVGGLDVALGVGAAVVTGYGCGVAWADAPDSSSSESSASDSKQADKTTAAPASAQPKDSSGVAVRTGGAHTRSESKKGDETKGRKRKRGSAAESAKASKSPDSKVDAVEVKVETRSRPAAKAAAETDAPVSSLQHRRCRRRRRSRQLPVTTAVTPPHRLWPTAFAPSTAVTDVRGLVSSLVSAARDPLPPQVHPRRPPSRRRSGSLLAWVRRELFNGSPRIDPVINPQTNGLITGNIGATDPDGDPLTYTVIGRPLNGGTVEVDEDGNFTYRPMNAMAAVGGTDQFTVVVSDEAAGLHVHGPLGLLKFVPILGNFVNPGGGDAVAQTITVNVEPVAGVDLSFPDDFHWGVAHAGFQAEGGRAHRLSELDPNPAQDEAVPASTASCRSTRRGRAPRRTRGPCLPAGCS